MEEEFVKLEYLSVLLKKNNDALSKEAALAIDLLMSEYKKLGEDYKSLEHENLVLRTINKAYMQNARRRNN